MSHLGSLSPLEELEVQERPLFAVLHCPGLGGMQSLCSHISYSSNESVLVTEVRGGGVLQPYPHVLGFSQWGLDLKAKAKVGATSQKWKHRWFLSLLSSEETVLG